MKRKTYMQIAVIILAIAGFTFANFLSRVPAKTEQNSAELGITVKKDMEFIWNVEKAVNIESLYMSGSVSWFGNAKAYIMNNGERHLILDNSELKRESKKTQIGFRKYCIDTCSIQDFNKESYKIVFEVSEGAVLEVDTIDYKTRRPEHLKFSLKEISLMSITIFVVMLLFAILVWYEKDNIKKIVLRTVKSILKVKEGKLRKFYNDLEKTQFLSRIDKNKAKEAYKELDGSYSKIARSKDISEKEKKRAHKLMEKVYSKVHR